MHAVPVGLHLFPENISGAAGFSLPSILRKDHYKEHSSLTCLYYLLLSFTVSNTWENFF